MAASVDDSFMSHSSATADSSLLWQMEEGEQQPEPRLFDGDHMLHQLMCAISEDFHGVVVSTAPSDEEMEGEEGGKAGREQAAFAAMHETVSNTVKSMLVTLDMNSQTRGVDAHTVSSIRQLHSESHAYTLIQLREQYKQQYLPFKDQSFLANLVSTDDDFRQMLTLLRWSEAVAAVDPTGFADLASEQNKLMSVRDIRSTTVRDSRALSRGWGADADAACHPDDDQLQERLLKTAFGFVRCGMLDEAIALLRQVGVPALVPLLEMRRYTVDPRMTPTDEDHPNYKIAERRQLFKKTAAMLIEKHSASLSSTHRLLLAVIAGRLEPCLSLASRTEDRIWCYANAAVEARLDEARLGGSAVQLGDAPSTLQAIFDEIGTGTDEAWPYYSVYKHLLTDDVAGCVHFMGEWVERHGENAPENVLRMMAHLVVVFRQQARPHAVNIGNRVIVQYVGRLLKLKLYDLMPFYASLLSEKTAHQAMLGTMAKIDGDSVRRGFLEALDAAGMDSGRLALDLVRRARGEAEGKDGAWLVDQWCWLTYHGSKTIHSALIEANALFRRFYVCEDDSCARLLLQRGLTREGDLADRAELEIRRIGTRIPARLQRAVLEYRAFVLHIESEDAMSSWVKAEGEAVEAAGRADRAKEGGAGGGEGADVRLARRRLDEDAQRARRTAEVRKQKAVDLVETFLRHPGWRETVRVDDKDEEEESRLSDLSSLRCRVFCDSLCVLVQLHARSGDARAALEVAHMVCDDRMNIQQDLSREKLQLVLEAIHSAGGHLLE